MKQILALLRVSTLQQDLDAQKEAVTRAIIHDGYTVDEIQFIEKKESAIKLKEEEREGLILCKGDRSNTKISVSFPSYSNNVPSHYQA